MLIPRDSLFWPLGTTRSGFLLYYPSRPLDDRSRAHRVLVSGDTGTRRRTITGRNQHSAHSAPSAHVPRVVERVFQLVALFGREVEGRVEHADLRNDVLPLCNSGLKSTTL
jgi:hypothetical protein